jgi:hypothetical protein
VRIWFGVGFDGWTAEVARRKTSLSAATDWFVQVAQLAVTLGVEAVVWDAEEASKEAPAAGTTLARAVLTEVRRRYPALPQGWTAYDHPVWLPTDRVGGHSSYPWRTWLGPGGADFALPQVYAAPKQTPGRAPVMAARGALEKRFATHGRSWRAAVTQGLIREDVPVHPYVQAHHVRAQDTIAVCASHALVSLWASPTRIDADGTRAIEVLCALRRAAATGVPPEDREARVWWAQQRLRAWQLAGGTAERMAIAVDGAWGPLSSAACKVFQAAHGLSPSGVADEATCVKLAAIGG